MAAERPSGRYSVAHGKNKPEAPPSLMGFTETKETIEQQMIDRIAHIMAFSFPAGSNVSQEILEFYYREGKEQLSVIAMEHIIEAIRNRLPGVGYEILGKHEKEIVPRYAEQLKRRSRQV